ncbi:MAG: C40 family peptidase [Elusimicrobia bacterium]|nr:C40 family peptidase [Elusimicrobiota bacterium]
MRLALLALLALASSAGAVSIQQARDRIVAGTMKYLNVPYLWGSEHPKTGLDCSAFVRRVYADAGFPLPRVSRDQFKTAVPVKPRDVMPGDLVFFSMKHPGTADVDHVGIYVGKGWFVHAGVSNGVRVEPISKAYWGDRLIRVLKYPGF